MITSKVRFDSNVFLRIMISGLYDFWITYRRLLDETSLSFELGKNNKRIDKGYLIWICSL